MIYLASDHRGMIRKEEIKKTLDQMKEEYVDCGNMIYDPSDDEVDFVNKACAQLECDLINGKKAQGIFFCGSGVMVDVAANKFPKIRACLGFSKKQVEEARHDDDVNVLCLGADFFDNDECEILVKTFLKNEFSGEERFRRRIEKLKN